MTLTKDLILGGVVGLTGLGVTTGSIAYGSVNLGVKDREEGFGIPEKCEKNECELSEEQLKKVKFKDLKGSSGGFSFEGLKDGKIKFKLAKGKNTANKWYVFYNTGNENEVKIKRGEKTLTLAKKTDSYFKGEDGYLVFVVTKLNSDRKRRIGEVNAILKSVGITGLELEMGDFTEGIVFKNKEKELSEEDFKKIRFYGLVGNGEIKVSNWEKGKTVTLSLEHTNERIYFKNLKFRFKNNTGKEIKLENGKNGENNLKFKNNNNESELFKAHEGLLYRKFITFNKKTQK